jgi:hypothetical protein
MEKSTYFDLQVTDSGSFKWLSSNECVAYLDFIEPINDVSDYVRVNGWIFSATDEKSPTLVRFIGKGGLVVGFALTGTPRPDVKDAINKKAGLAGFRGYLQSDATGTQVIAEGSNPTCHLNVNVSAKMFDTRKLPLSGESSDSDTVKSSSVIANNGWTGTDFQHSNIAQMVVLGSHRDSDADTGSLIVKMKRGDKLFYSSGPTDGRQIVEVLGAPQLVAKLPVAIDWIQLDFSSGLLPATFELKFSDNGNGWGEWSAIAIRN